MNHAMLYTAITSIQRLGGVAGILLFKGRNTVYQQMPFSEGRTLELIEILSEMLNGYHQVRRSIRQIILQFDGGVLLVLAGGPAVIVFLLNGRADTDIVAGAGGILLRDFAPYLATLGDQPMLAMPAPMHVAVAPVVVAAPQEPQPVVAKEEPKVSPKWEPLRKQIEALLGKVMGRAQVGMMIDRMLAKRGIKAPSELAPSAMRALAVALIDQVPNTAKRQSLLSELEVTFTDLKL